MTLGNAGEMAMEDDDRPLKEECVLPPEVDEGLKEAGGRDGILSKLPTCESLKERAEVHQALSDPVRLRIVHLLGLSALCPCVLKDLTGLSDSKLSYHLSILEKAGLVAWRQNKNWRVYRSTDLLMTYLVQGYV